MSDRAGVDVSSHPPWIAVCFFSCNVIVGDVGAVFTQALTLCV